MKSATQAHGVNRPTQEWVEIARPFFDSRVIQGTKRPAEPLLQRFDFRSQGEVAEAKSVFTALEDLAVDARVLVNPRFRAIMRRQRQIECQLVRCVLGNPFRPTTIDTGLLTSDVVKLATAIYAERAFDRLPILADALEDAGCINLDLLNLLNHCRESGPHVRGCWVIDLILSKDR